MDNDARDRALDKPPDQRSIEILADVLQKKHRSVDGLNVKRYRVLTHLTGAFNRVVWSTRPRTLAALTP